MTACASPCSATRRCCAESRREAGDVFVADTFRREVPGLVSRLNCLIGARAWHVAHVEQTRHRVAFQQADELSERPRRVADGSARRQRLARTACTRRRSTGNSSSSNHRLRWNHAVLRGDGCGSGTKRGA